MIDAVVRHNTWSRLSSEVGQEKTSREQAPMYALHLKADMAERDSDLRFVPKADIKVYLLRPSFRCPTMLSGQFHECVQRRRGAGRLTPLFAEKRIRN